MSLPERSDPAAPAGFDAVRPPTNPPRWALQFGLLEFFGLLLSIGLYYALCVTMLHETAWRLYGRRESAPDEVRLLALGIGVLFSGAGSYLSARLATSRNMRSAWERALLQLAFSFFVVPFLVGVTGFVLIIFFACLFRL